MSDTPEPDKQNGFDVWWNDHEKGCPQLVLDTDEALARAAWLVSQFGFHTKIAEMRGQMNGTYGAGRGWEAALDEMEKFLK